VEPSSTWWTTVADSPHDHEREALAFLRRRLYDREPYHVWANFEFVAPSGALYEVDALAVTDNGIHLIEIKSHPGTIGGDAATWEWITPQGKRRYFDNPRQLANRKGQGPQRGCRVHTRRPVAVRHPPARPRRPHRAGVAAPRLGRRDRFGGRPRRPGPA